MFTLRRGHQFKITKEQWALNVEIHVDNELVRISLKGTKSEVSDNG